MGDIADGGELDLSSLKIEREPLPVPVVNRDYIVRYPAPPDTAKGEASDRRQAGVPVPHNWGA